MSIEIVAKRAGVSPTTVARVINRSPLVSPATVEQVKRAMQETGYTPPAPAQRRGPRTAKNQGLRTGNVACLLVAMSQTHMRSTPSLNMIATALTNHGLNLILVPMPDPAKLPPIIDLKHVDGVIAMGMEPIENASQQLRKVPTVWMMTRRSDTFWADYVQPDNEGNARLAVQHLMGKGHRHLGVINLQPNYPAFRMRGAAFASFARAHGASVFEPRAQTVDPSPVLQYEGEGEETFLANQLRDLAKAKPRPTGIYLVGALSLATVILELQKQRLDADKRLELVVGDYSPEWMSRSNLLSAYIDTQFSMIALRTVDQLLWRIQHPDEPGPVGISIPPKLVLPAA